MANNMRENEDSDSLYIIGLNLGDNFEFRDIFTFTLVGDIDRPLMRDGKIIFFSKLELASAALNLTTTDYKTPPSDVALVCDVPEMIEFIENEDIDNASTILNCLNTFFDLINALNVWLRSDYKEILFNFADHLTFNREFASYLHDNDIHRRTLIEAVYCCLQHIFYGGNLLTPNGLIDMSSLTIRKD